MSRSTPELGRSDDRAARFRALAANPPRGDESRPSGVVPALGMLALAAFGALFGGFAVFFLLNARRGSAPGDLFFIVPMIFVIVGAGIIVVNLVRLFWYLSSTAQQIPVMIVGKRIRHYGGGDSRGSAYYATVEYEDGARAEFHTSGRLAGLLVEGDMGYAWLKGRYFIGFDRVSV